MMILILFRSGSYKSRLVIIVNCFVLQAPECGDVIVYEIKYSISYYILCRFL